MTECTRLCRQLLLKKTELTRMKQRIRSSLEKHETDGALEKRLAENTAQRQGISRYLQVVSAELPARAGNRKFGPENRSRH